MIIMKFFRPKTSTIFLVAFTLSILASGAFGEIYSIDPNHTEVGFSIRHLVISNVKGAFVHYSGEFERDTDNNLKSLALEIEVKSIDTRIQKRDKHLLSADFFEVAKYPKMTFHSTTIKLQKDGTYAIKGILQIKEITRPIKLTGTLSASVKDPWGEQRIGLVAKGTINRKDFGLVYNKILENGGLLIGEDVTIFIEGEGLLKKESRED